MTKEHFLTKYKYLTFHTLLSNNVQMAYIDEGIEHEKVLLFIHGLGSYLPSWYKNIEVLKQNYRCIAIDLPGYGQSAQGNYPYSMRFYAHVILEFIEKFKLKHVTLVGHSMGAQIAVKTIIYEEGAVEKLVLAAPAGFETFNHLELNIFKNIHVASLLRIMSPQQVIRNFEVNFHKMPSDIQFMIDDRIRMMDYPVFYKNYCDTVYQNAKAMLDEPIYDDLPLLDLPTLIVFGENDKLIPTAIHPLESTKSIARKGNHRISHSRLEMVPQAGHFVMYEQAEIFNNLISAFV